MIKELTYNHFNVIKNDNLIHIIIFTALWCDSCKMAKVPLEELSDIYDVYQVDVEKELSISKTTKLLKKKVDISLKLIIWIF